MKKLIVGIGIPGSGKTTVLKDFAREHNYFYLCPDDIREEMTGRAADQSRNKEAWDEAHRRMREQLNEGSTLVFDATFANYEQRKEFLALAREYGAEKIEGVFFDVALDLAKERNQSRERTVPEYVLEQMNKSLRDFPPVIEDGFDTVFTMNAEKKIKLLKGSLVSL